MLVNVIYDAVITDWEIVLLIADGKPTAASNEQYLISKANNKVETLVNWPTLIIQVGTTWASTTAPEHGKTHASSVANLVL